MGKECSSFILGSQICRDGFPQTPYCKGSTCHSCGSPSKSVPLCLADEVPAHLVDAKGMPRFASHRTGGQKDG